MPYRSNPYLVRKSKPVSPVVSILIVTYNSSALLAACLNSIAASTQVEHEIILVDNASQDDTVALARRNYPAVHTLQNQQNRGFSAAVNQASHLAQGRYLLLLNPDTIVHSGAIDRLVEELDRHPQAGLAAPRTVNPDGSLRTNHWPFQRFRIMLLNHLLQGRFRRFWRFFRRPTVRLHGGQVQYAESFSGAVLLIQADLYRALHGLDERFFMYFEDMDLCYRAHQAGRPALYVPQAVVTHAGGRSTPGDELLYLNKIGKYFLASQYRYVQKHSGIGAMLVIRLVHLLTGIIYCCRGRLQPKGNRRKADLDRGRILLQMAASLYW